MPETTAHPPCPLCGRPLDPAGWVDEHHLVPRSAGGRETVRLHRLCHRQIHALLREDELRDTYNTPERLRAHPGLARFIRWVRKQPVTRHRRSRKSRRLCR